MGFVVMGAIGYLVKLSTFFSLSFLFPLRAVEIQRGGLVYFGRKRGRREEKRGEVEKAN